MNLREIVGAIVEGNTVTTSVSLIDACMATGRHLQFITRRQAEQRAKHSANLTWTSLSQAPTLFLVDNGIRFRQVSHN